MLFGCVCNLCLIELPRNLSQATIVEVLVEMQINLFNKQFFFTVLSVKGKQIRIGIDAPEDVSVHREEIYERIIAGEAVAYPGGTSPKSGKGTDLPSDSAANNKSDSFTERKVDSDGI